MKRCDRCGGSGLATAGVFAMTADCPDCNGSGWVDVKIQGPPPERMTWRCSCGAVHLRAHFGMKCPACGAVLPSSKAEALAVIAGQVAERQATPAAAPVVKTRPKKKKK